MNGSDPFIFLILRYAFCTTDLSEWFWWYLQCDAISTILPQGLEYESSIKDHYLSCSQSDSKLKHVDMLCGASDLGWFGGFSGWDGSQLNNPYANLGNAPSSLITLEEDLDNAVAQFRKHSIK